MQVFVRIIFGLIVVIGVGLGARALLLSNYLKVKSVLLKVDGETTVEMYKDDVRDKVQSMVSDLTGQSIWDIGLEDFSESVHQDKRVEGIQVQRRWPDRLGIKLKLRPSKAFVLYRDKVYPISNEAHILPAVAIKNLVSLPVLRGKAFYESNELRKKALTLIEELPNKVYFTPEAISEIHFKKKDGFVVYLSKNKARIKMGDTHFARRALMVEKVLNYLFHEQLNARVIDARFSKKVVVKLRNRS